MLNKKYISLFIFLCSFTCLTHAYWQNGWSASPLTLSAAGQVATAPQIAIDSEGNGIAVWAYFDGSVFTVQAKRYIQATNSWGSVEDLSAAGHGGRFPQVAIDLAGNAIVVWYVTDGSNTIVWARRYVQATDSWDPETDLSAAGENADSSQVAMDSDGNGIAVWYRYDGSKNRVQARRYVQATDSWDSVTDLSAAGENANEPQVSMDSDGNGIAVWYRSDGSNAIVQARRYVQATDSWDLVTDLSAALQDAL